MLVVSVAMLCAVLSIFYLAPASTFLFNGQEVVVSLGQVISLSLAPQLLFLGVGLAVAALGGRAVRVRISTLSAALALLVYLQGSLFVWDYGQFDGSEVNWARHELLGLLEMAVWLAVLVGSQIFAERLVRLAPFVALLAVLLQLCSIGLHVAAGRDWDHSAETEVDPNLFHFSREQNVVILLLDGFQSHAFDAILETTPELAEKLQGFVYFQDTLSVFPTTFMSLPAMLSGEIYDNTIPTHDFLEDALKETSLPDWLASRGFQSSILTRALYCEYFARSACTGQLEISGEDRETRRQRDAMRIWNVSLFRHVPHSFKRQVYRDHQWLLGRKPATGPKGYLHAPSGESAASQPTDRQQASGLLWEMLYRNADTKSESKTFKFLHLWSSHTPHVVSENCELFDTRRDAPVSSLLRNLYQSRCALDAALRFVDVLRGLGVLDQTLVMIAADHGSPATLPSLQGPEPSRVNRNRAFPLLLVKPIGSEATFQITRRPASLADLPHTVAGLLGGCPVRC